MRVVKSVYGPGSIYRTQLEKGMVYLLGDLENYTSQIIKTLHIPGSSTKLRGTLRVAIKGLKNYEHDLFERLISFGRSLRILVDSTSHMNKDVAGQIKNPTKFLIQTYVHIAFQTEHKEITDTAQRLMKDVSDDPNEVNTFIGY